MRKQVFLMTYRNVYEKCIICTALFMVFFFPMPVHTYNVLHSLENKETFSMREKLLELHDSEKLETLRLKDANIDKSTPHVVVPLKYKLVVGLHGRNWVLDAQRSQLTESDTSNIILQELQELEETSIFVFARNSIGVNKLVFSRIDNTTADEFSYILSVMWVDTNTSVTTSSTVILDDKLVLLHDQHAIVMIILQDSFDKIAYLFSSDKSQNILSKFPKDNHTTSFENENNVAINTKQNNEEKFSHIDSTQKEGALENKLMQNKAITSDNGYQVSLQKINSLLKIGNYEGAQSAIEKYKNSINSKNIVSRLLFDSAQYLEKMHEREGTQSIQNIERAITFYNLIIDGYPLSVVYDKALARREFLQKKYIFIR